MDLNRRPLGLWAVLCALLCAVLCALLYDSTALAYGSQPVARGLAAPQGTPGILAGTIVGVEDSNFTIQTGGRRTGLINALAQAASAVTAQDYPYVWGGGHAEAGVASIGDVGGPGANGKRLGYDCSGAVAAVLAAAGLWPAGGFVPNDAGVIAELLARGLIAPGPGIAPDEVTFYDHPGVHIFMSIDGRFFGTSDGGAGGNGKGGAGWLDDSASDVRSSAFKEYHLVPSVLHDQTIYGQDYTFQLPLTSSLLDGFLLGDDVRVDYRASEGSMNAGTLSWVGQLTATATVTSFTPDGSGIVVQTSDGRRLTLDATDVEDALATLEPGDTVQLIYLRGGGALVARSLTVVAVPLQLTAAGTITSIARDLSSFTIKTAAGRRLSFSTAGNSAMLTGLAPGESIEVAYTKAPVGPLTATQLSPVETSSPATGTATTPAGTTPTGTTTTPAGTTPTGTTTTPAGTTPTSTTTTPAGTTPTSTTTTPAGTTPTGTASGDRAVSSGRTVH